MNPRHVLVVENSAANAKLFKIVLERAGFRVTIAGSVVEALIVLRKAMPDALVCELLLGLLGNGYDVVTAVRSTGIAALAGWLAQSVDVLA